MSGWRTAAEPLYQRQDEKPDAPNRHTYRAPRRRRPTELSVERLRLRVRDEWRFPITNQATRIGFKKTGLTGGGPKPSADRQEGPDGPTKLSKTKVFAFTRRASSASGRPRPRRAGERSERPARPLYGVRAPDTRPEPGSSARALAIDIDDAAGRVKRSA